MTQKRPVGFERWNRWMWLGAWLPAFVLSGLVEDLIVGEDGSFAVGLLVRVIAAVALMFAFMTLFEVIRRLRSQAKAAEEHVKQPE